MRMRRNAMFGSFLLLLFHLFYVRKSNGWIKSVTSSTSIALLSRYIGKGKAEKSYLINKFPKVSSITTLWSSSQPSNSLQQQLEELIQSLGPPPPSAPNSEASGKSISTLLPPNLPDVSPSSVSFVKETNTVVPSSSNKNQKVYIPRSNRVDAAPATTPQTTTTSSSSTYSSYKSKSYGSSDTNPNRKSYSPPFPSSSSSSSSSSSNFPPAGHNNNNINNNNPPTKEVTLLTNPQLLIQYRVPREMTLRKRALLEEIKSRSGGSGANGGFSSGKRPSSGGPVSSSINGRRSNKPIDLTLPIPIGDDDEDLDVDSVGGRRRDKEKDKEKTKKQLEDEAAAAEERRKKKSSMSKTAAAVDQLDLAEEAFYDDSAVMQLTDDGDVFDDGTVLDSNISRIPLGFFRTMEEDEVPYEEIQNLIFTEYGKTVSIDAIRRKMNSVGSNAQKKRKKKSSKNKFNQRIRQQQAAAQKLENIIIIPDKETITISELADMTKISSGEIIKYLMFNEGLMITINQQIAMELAIKLLQVFNKDYKLEKDLIQSAEKTLVQIEIKAAADKQQQLEEDENNSHLMTRAPVVTIMGHVDHGKTSLLDSIRNARVAQSEAGGITQAISAFNVQTSTGKNITFIDTPGHAAFSEMRKRGAQMTDIVVLVVAADDGVMEQTKECIEAAKAANCPIVIAINKIDKEGADVNNAKAGLLNAGVVLEELGGDVQCAEISARQGVGINELLEKILIQAEVMELKGDLDASLEAIIVEAKIDKGLGVVATALVQKGIIRTGQVVVAGPSWGKVRSLVNDKGKTIAEAGPSEPIRIVGLNRVPNAGDKLILAVDEESAKEMAEAIFKYEKGQVGASTFSNLKGAISSFASGSYDDREVIKVPIILKADVGGSLEAIKSVLENITSADDNAVCKVDFVSTGVGDVTTSDVLMATASKARIIAFNVAATSNAMEEARGENIDIQYYSVLYNIIDDVTDLVKKTLSPPPPGELTGFAEVKKIFRVGKSGKVAGCSIKEGRVLASGNVRVLRDKKEVFSGSISSLRVVKDNVQEVNEGEECGIQIKDFDELLEGDIIQCYLVNKGDSSSGENSNEE